MFPLAWHWFLTSIALVILMGKAEASQREENRPNDTEANVEKQRASYVFFHQSEYPRDCLEVLGQCSNSYSSGVYLIKPDGYSEPFDVYCDNDVLESGWTIVERRLGQSVIYNRTWEDYESGFGFLSHEHWIGNRKLSYITNQGRYKLRIDVTLNDGSSFYATYDNFRISDAFSNYEILSTGQYNGTAGFVVSWCRTNMVYDTCTCQGTCSDPDSCNISFCTGTESCVCPSGFLMNDGDCIPLSECNCFIAETGTLLQDGNVYVSPNCSRKCVCTSGQLECNNHYQCSPNGACLRSEDDWQCACNPGYEGDGVKCESSPTDCHDIFVRGQRDSGVYNIKPTNWRHEPFRVFCDMANDGGWTVFQRQQDGSEDFYRVWDDYKNGFGSPGSEGNWLGNDKLYHLTNQNDYELRIDLVDSSGTRYVENYNLFRINDESDKYRLSAIGTYRGDTGNNALSWHLDKQFSTRDQDNDGWSEFDCAEQHRGGWWFGNWYRCTDYYSNSYCRAACPDRCDWFPVGSSDCAGCASSHLNGDYDGTTRARNTFWYANCGLQNTEMKIRPVQI